MDPLHPITDRPPRLPAIPKVQGRRIETEDRERQREEQRRRGRDRREPEPPPE